MKSLRIGIATLTVLMLVGCGEKAPEPTAGPGSANAGAGVSTNVQSYPARGVIKKIEAAENTITIQHEEILAYMPAMTMPFKVKDPKESQGLQPGDKVEFRLWVTADESWIDNIKKDTAPDLKPAAAPPQREAFRVARDVEPLKIGDLMPDYRFTNELGRVVSLSDFKGQALAFTFIYTRCPLPDFCPRMSKNFSDVYQKLTTMPNAPTNWHLLTISFDPYYDTPDVLRAYAQAFQYDPKRWNFATGAMVDIDAITDQFTLVIVKQGDQWDHKVRTVVVAANGRIQQIIYGNVWKPEALVEEIIKAAKQPPAQPAAAR